MILNRGLLGLILVGSFAGLAAPVVAASGWVLLVPPEVPGHGEGGTKFEVHAPLARWRQAQAFDTARECEGELNDKWVREQREVERRLPTPPSPVKRHSQEYDKAFGPIPESGTISEKRELNWAGSINEQWNALPPSARAVSPAPQPIDNWAGTLNKKWTPLPPDAPGAPLTPRPVDDITQGNSIQATWNRLPPYEKMPPELRDPVYEEKVKGWEREVKRVEAAREPKQREVNERYRHWKCVPADAVYHAPK